MKKFLLFVLLASAMNIMAQYSTPGTGVNWNLDSLVSNSGGVITGTFPTYTVINKITIDTNDVITILPGTTIYFNTTTAGIDVSGALLAEGTVTDSIRFSSTTQDSTNGWTGLRFDDSSIDSLCRIKYARIEFGEYAPRCIGASPSVTYCYIFKNNRGPYLSSGSNPIIRYNKIERTFEYGINATTGSSPIIEYNELVNNNTQNTSPKNQISVGTQNNNSPTIRYNVIHGGWNNKTGGISISTLFGGSSSSAEIAFNTIYDNSYGIALAGIDNTCYVHDNLIYNNNINPDPMIAGSGINIGGSATNTPKVTRNTIYGNKWGITVQNGSSIVAGPVPKLGDITNADTTDDGYNTIYDNTHDNIVFDLFSNVTNDFMAQNNDWKVYDSLLIEAHITHKPDSSLRGTVNFIPFLTPVPVELVNFSATSLNDVVYLNWATATELNNSGFIVERKNLENEEYQLIVFIKGKGNSSELTNYSFTDRPGTSKAYYRLKQVDLDGTIKVLKVVEVDLNTISDFSLMQNYPNPFNPSTKINFNLKVDSNIKLKLFDALGQQVTLLSSGTFSKGLHSMSFDFSNYSGGVYFYQMEATGVDGSNFTSVKKMIYLK